MAKRRSFGQRVKRHLTVAIWTILYFVIVPTVICCAIPFYVFRCLVWVLKSLFRPDLDNFIHPRSAVLARDDWSREPGWNLVVWLTMEGVLDLDKFRRDFLNEYVMRRESPSGKFTYPEYQQHYESWLGFQFWKWDKKFDINNHIRTYDGPFNADVVNDNDLTQIVKHLTWKPWEPKKSPWEFMQIPKYNDGSNDGVHKSLLLFRIHHGLGDGYYILKLLMEDISGISLADALGKPQYVRRTVWQKMALAMGFWLRAPYQFMDMVATAYDVNPWHSTSPQKLQRPMNAAFTGPIKLDYIKEIKNAHNVTFTAVIQAAIAGGIRNLMIEKGVPVPAEMHSAVAVPMPGHPPKLRNHFIFSFIELPVGIEDPLKRLKKMDKFYMGLKRNSAPLANFLKVPLIGLLPTSLMKPFCTNHLSTCLISNFPGTPTVPNFKGTNVLDMMFNAGLGEGSCNLGFCLISYVDHIRLISEADPGILPTDEDLQNLNQKILEELDLFKSLGCT